MRSQEDIFIEGLAELTEPALLEALVAEMELIGKQPEAWVIDLERKILRRVLRDLYNQIRKDSLFILPMVLSKIHAALRIKRASSTKPEEQSQEKRTE